MDINLGIFNLDIYKEIIIKTNITTLIDLSLVCKNFNEICNEKAVLLDKFYSKNLIIIDDDLITIREHVNEYIKLAYSEFMSDCLLTNLLLDSESKYFVIDTKKISDEMMLKIFPEKICLGINCAGSSLPPQLEKRNVF